MQIIYIRDYMSIKFWLSNFATALFILFWLLILELDIWADIETSCAIEMRLRFETFE